MSALSRGLKSVVKGVDDSFKTIGSKIMVNLPGLIGSTVGLFSRLLDQWSAPPPPPWASENTRLLMMGVATIIIKSFQKNKRWSKKAETSPAEIDPTFTISWFVLSNLGGVSTLTLIEVLLILFEGSLFETRPRAWEVGLLIFSESPFMCLTPTEFIPKFTDLLTPGFMSELAFFMLLSYPTILSVKRKIWGYEPSAWWDCMIKPDFCLINGELKPLNALRNVWLTDCILNQYVKLTLSLLRASCYTQDWWSDIDLRTKKTVKECLNRLIQYRHSSLRQTFWLVCHEVELPLNSCIIIPYEVNQISFDGFSTLIAERFSSWTWEWMICFRTDI